MINLFELKELTNVENEVLDALKDNGVGSSGAKTAEVKSLVDQLVGKNGDSVVLKCK